MDDYMDPYEEAEAVEEATGLGGPADKDSFDDSDQDDSEAESDYEEKSYNLPLSGNHQVRNPDETFCCPFYLGMKKQDYKLKGLLQHADGIGSGKTVSALSSQIKTKNQHLLDLETKNATEFSTSRLEEDSRKLHEAYNEGTLSICSLFFLWLLMVKRNLVNLHFC
jgi:hypothetical protein